MIPYNIENNHRAFFFECCQTEWKHDIADDNKIHLNYYKIRHIAQNMKFNFHCLLMTSVKEICPLKTTAVKEICPSKTPAVKEICQSKTTSVKEICPSKTTAVKGICLSMTTSVKEICPSMTPSV